MENPIKEYVSITIELVITALLITIVVAFSGMSNNALNRVIQDKDYVANIEEYKNLYMFDRVYIRSSDIPDIILKYIRYYEFNIWLDGATPLHQSANYRLNADAEKQFGERIWTQDYILNTILSNNMESRFYSVIVEDNYGMIKGINFIEE